MAKRAPLSFDAVKATKAVPATTAPEPVENVVDASEGDAAPAARSTARRGRGRPRKRDAGVKTFGLTLRVSPELRRALRRAAEQEEDRRGGFESVAVHDVIMAAIESDLRRRKIEIE